VEAPICRVGVFGCAIGAHREDGHGGLGPVVGDVFDDGEARAAVGAVDEGVAVAAVGGVEEFAQTVGANADIRRDGLEGVGDGFGVFDFKGLVAGRFARADLDLVEMGQGRGLGAQALDEFVQNGRLALQFDIHPGGGVAHPASESQAGGEVVDKGSESDSLDDAGDVDGEGGGHFGFGIDDFRFAGLEEGGEQEDDDEGGNHDAQNRGIVPGGNLVGFVHFSDERE
jgi:hypothetical protein